MRCLYCGKKLSLLKLAKGDSFCSSEHFDAHQLQLSKSAFDRLRSVSGAETPRPPLVFPPAPAPTEDAPPAAKTNPEVRALEVQPSAEQRRVAEQGQPEQPLKPKDAKAAHRAGPATSIAANAEPKLIPPAEVSLTADAMARLKAFDGPPQAPFAFTQLPPFPPASETPVGVVEPSTEAEDAKHELVYPMHAAEATVCILNLYLGVNQARFLPADWRGPARSEEPAGEPFRAAATLPALAVSPDFPQYVFEPGEEDVAELAPAIEARLPVEAAVPVSAALEAFGPVASAPLLEVVEQTAHTPAMAALAPAVDAALSLAPAVPASGALASFGPVESAAPAKPMMPSGPKPESPLPAVDRRVRYLTAPSFHERTGGDSRFGDSRFNVEDSLEASPRALGPALPSGSRLVKARELSAHAGFAAPPEWTPARLKTQPVSGRDEFPLSPMRLLPEASAPKRILRDWHTVSNAIRLAPAARDGGRPLIKPVGFLPAAANFAVRPGFNGDAATLLVPSQGAVLRPVLPVLGSASPFPHQQQAELPEIARALPSVPTALEPSLGRKPLGPSPPVAIQGGTPPSNAFSFEPAAGLCPPALASSSDWQRLSADGWNAAMNAARAGEAEPWQAKENAPPVDRREPEPGAFSARLSSPQALQVKTAIQKGLKISSQTSAAFVPASEIIGFWPEAMSRLAAALPSGVPADAPAACVEKCAAFRGWEAKTVAVPAAAPAKFLPARGGAVLPVVAEWPRLGAPPL